MKLQIRNSTAEFLTFAAETGEQSIEVLYANENVWATQAMMCELYDCSKSNVSEHLKAIFSSGELKEDAVVRKFRTTGSDGKKIKKLREIFF
jgi:hypothetical protein